jgi:hypothetical protein
MQQFLLYRCHASMSLVVIASSDNDAPILLIPLLGDCFIAVAPRNDNKGFGCSCQAS